MSEMSTTDAEESACSEGRPHGVPAPGAAEAFDAFVKTIAALRAPDGCPWDREQTHESIASNMLEEAFEAVDAIEAHDVDHMREELGDVLLQVVLQSQIAADEGEFTIVDVCREVDEKIVRRHPHVFGTAQAESAGEVLELWDSVKLAEKGAADAQADAAGEARKGLLDGVPKAFPALLQAQKVSRKAAAAGFEWDTVDEVWEKVDEEIGELKDAFRRAPKTDKGKVAEGGHAQVEEELGDVLFALVNVARKMGLDAEGALRASCTKFRRRWAEIEHAAWADARAVEDLAMDEMQALWDRAKAHEAAGADELCAAANESCAARAEGDADAPSGCAAPAGNDGTGVRA